MTTVAQILHSVRARLTDPRHWLQGNAFGVRRADGRIIPGWAPGARPAEANCFCLSEAITRALDNLVGPGVSWTELRSDVELALLQTIDELDLHPSWAPQVRCCAAYQFNDDLKTSHAAVLDVIERTLQRLPEAA